MADLELDFDNLDPAAFAQLVKTSSDDQINAVLTGPSRKKILDEIFRRMPDLFRADRAGSTEAVIHWSVTGAPGGGEDTYEVVIADGKCTTTDTPAHEPKLALTISPVDFAKVISGNGNPVMLFMSGKLKAKGDLGLAANIGNLFNIPKA
jgi:putative sterol carrier protein